MAWITHGNSVIKASAIEAYSIRKGIKGKCELLIFLTSGNNLAIPYDNLQECKQARDSLDKGLAETKGR